MRKYFIKFVLAFIIINTLNIKSINADTLEYWNNDSQTIQSLVDFILKCENTVPKEDRVAVFDLDGTLISERSPSYFEDLLVINRILYDSTYNANDKLKTYFADYEKYLNNKLDNNLIHFKEIKKQKFLAFKGMSNQEFKEYIADFKDNYIKGFNKLKYSESFFKPMISLIEYLYNKNFTIYICSGSSKETISVLIKDKLDKYITSDNLLGSVIEYDKAGLIKGDILFHNTRYNKVISIEEKIGKVPILVFGNSTIDFDMGTYTIENSKYPSRTYMLLCDDTDRDYGDLDYAQAFKLACIERKFNTISMKNDFETIYGYDIIKCDYKANNETISKIIVTLVLIITILILSKINNKNTK